MKRALCLLPVMLIAVPPSQASAQTLAQAFSCAAIASDPERLACYDDLFMTPEDEARAAIVLQSEQLIPAVPSGRGNATVTIACEPDGLAVRFGFAGNVVSPLGSNTGITLQRDLLRGQAITLPPDETGTELVISGPGEVEQFIASLAGVTNLGLRVTASARTFNVRFRVVGIAEQVAPVVAACAS